MKFIDKINEFIDGFWQDVKDFISAIWADISEFYHDLSVSILTMLLDGLAAAISAIPLPSFLVNVNLSTYIPADVGYFLDQSNFAQCLAIIGAGIGFKIARRIATLGIW